MEKIFEKFQGLEVKHDTYTGIVCGYNDDHFILAIKASSHSYGFRKLPKESVITGEYISNKYKYVYEDETELIKQYNERKNKSQAL